MTPSARLGRLPPSPPEEFALLGRLKLFLAENLLISQGGQLGDLVRDVDSGRSGRVGELLRGGDVRLLAADRVAGLGAARLTC